MSSGSSLIGRIATRLGKERVRDRFLRLAVRLPEPVIRSLAALRKPANRTNRPQAPETLFFFITNTCNQSCIHCFYSAELNRPSQGMSLEAVHTLGRSLAGRTSTVFLCGGELH